MLRVRLPFLTPYGDMAELADVSDLGSDAVRVWVRLPLSLPFGALTATLLESTFN